MEAAARRIDACCTQLLSVPSAAAQQAASSELKAILRQLVQYPADVSQSEHVHVLAGYPSALPLMTALLIHSDTGPWTWAYAASAVTFCIDNFWGQLNDDVRYETRTQLLSWLAARGLQSNTATRSAAVSALARISTLSWRTDVRHHATAGHVLQFLAPGRDAGHILLGLEIVSRLTQDMVRPHAALSDNARPAVRLLMYRDLALKPFTTRMVGLLQELLQAAVAAVSQAIASTGPSPTPFPPQSLSVPLQLGAKVLDTLHGVLTGFRFGLDAGPGTAGEEDDASMEEADQDDDAFAVNLPSAWDNMRTHGPTMTAVLWLRLALLTYHAARACGAGQGTVWADPGVQSAVLSLGPAALQLVGDLGACKCVYWRDEDMRARRALLMRSLTPVMLYCLAAPPACRQELDRQGWLHGVCRAAFRVKLSLPLVYMMVGPAEGLDFLAALAAFTYAAYARKDIVLGQAQGSLVGPEPAWRSARTLPLPVPPSSPSLWLSPTTLPALRLGENCLYYLRSAWLLLLMPASLLSRDEPGAHALRSCVRPLLMAMLDRYAPQARPEGMGSVHAPPGSLASGRSEESGPFTNRSSAFGQTSHSLAGRAPGSMHGSGDEEDSDGEGAEAYDDMVAGEDIDAGAQAANVSEQVDDDSVELAAEFGRFAAYTACREVCDRIRVCTSAIMQPGRGTGGQEFGQGQGEAQDKRTARRQRQLAWLVRFSSLLGSTVVTPGVMDEQAGVEDAGDEDDWNSGGQDGHMASLTFGEHWTHPSVSLDAPSVLSRLSSILSRGFESGLMAPVMPGFVDGPAPGQADRWREGAGGRPRSSSDSAQAGAGDQDGNLARAARPRSSSLGASGPGTSATGGPSDSARGRSPVPGTGAGQGSGLATGSSVLRSLRSDVAVTGQLPSVVGHGRDGWERPEGGARGVLDGVGMGAAAPRLPSSTAPLRLPIGSPSASLPSTTNINNNIGMDEGDEDEFDDEVGHVHAHGYARMGEDGDGSEYDEPLLAGGHSTPNGPTPTPRWRAPRPGLTGEAALMRWYEAGAEETGVYTMDSEDDEAGVGPVLLSFHVDMARQARYAALLSLPVRGPDVPTSEELRSARVARTNSVSGSLGRVLADAGMGMVDTPMVTPVVTPWAVMPSSPTPSASPVALPSDLAPERITADLAVAVLRATLLLRMRNALGRVQAATAHSSGVLAQGASSSREALSSGPIPAWPGSSAMSLGPAKSLSMTSPGQGSVASLMATPGGPHAGRGHHLSYSARSLRAGPGSPSIGRGDRDEDATGAGEDLDSSAGSADGEGGPEDAALMAELDAVGSSLLAKLQLGEGGQPSTAAALPAKPSLTAASPAGIGLSLAGGRPAGAAGLLSSIVASSSTPAAGGLSAPFAGPSQWGPSASAPSGQAAVKPRHSASSLDLDLALLSFYTAFHMWYSRYRAAAGAVLSLRSTLEAEGLLSDPELQDMPFLTPDDRPAPRAAGPLGTSFTVINGKLVPVDTVDGLPVGMGTGGPPRGAGDMAEDMGLGQGPRDGAARGSAGVAGEQLAKWLRDTGGGAARIGDLVSRMSRETNRNVLLLVCDALAARHPVEVLDTVVAKVLDGLRDPEPPPALLSASLQCLHDLALGVTLVLGNTAGQALTNGQGVGGVTSAGITGLNIPMWTSGPSGMPSLPDAVSIGDDLLKCVTVKALLRKPGTLLFPALKGTRHAKLRSVLYGTLTRLLFLHGRAISGPVAGLLKSKAKGDASTDGQPSSSAEDLVFDDRDGGVFGWFSSFMAPLAGTVDECRARLGMRRVSGSSVSGEAWIILSSIEVDLQGAANAGPGDAMDPRAMAAKPVLIGLLRDLRGVVSAASTPGEFRLVHDWLSSAGAHALLARAAQLYRGQAHGDVVVPLLRLLAELVSSRNSRMVFPPDNASGYVLVREVARATVAAAAGALMGSQGMSRGGTAPGAPETRLTQGSWELKLAGLVMLVAARALTCRACNTAIPSCYGDSSVSDLAHAALSVLLATPLSALVARRKTMALAMATAHALVTWASPPPLVPISDVLHGPGHPIPSAVQGDPGAHARVDRPPLGVPVHPGIGLPLRVSGLASLSMAVPCPHTVLSLLRLPVPMVAGLLARLSAGLDRRVSGTDGFVAACDALEAVLTVEADARMLCVLAGRPDSAIATSPATRLWPCPSGLVMTLAIAREVAARMDAHATAPASVYMSTEGGRSALQGTWVAAASGALDRGGLAKVTAGLAETPWGMTSGTSSSSLPSTAVLDGVLGLDFMTQAMLAGIRETGKGGMHGWGLGKLVLLNMLCRPAAFGAAATGLISMASSDWCEWVAESLGELAQSAETLPEPTSTASKDGFGLAFVRWARHVEGRL